MNVDHDRRNQIIGLVVGILVGVGLILGIHRVLTDNHHSGSGCPMEQDNSTETAEVFLYGTIGGDYSDPNRDCWREYEIQPVLDELGVSYFNPVVDNWTEIDAEKEAYAIANAETLVMVITANHPSIGSLAESGWALLSAIERDQTIIAYIADEQANEDSQRARKIVLSQARTLAPDIDQFILVDSVDEVVNELYKLYQN